MADSWLPVSFHLSSPRGIIFIFIYLIFTIQCLVWAFVYRINQASKVYLILILISNLIFLNIFSFEVTI